MRATRTARSFASSGGTNTGGGYSDIDMIFTTDGTYAHKDGTPYEARRGRSSQAALPTS